MHHFNTHKLYPPHPFSYAAIGRPNLLASDDDTEDYGTKGDDKGGSGCGGGAAASNNPYGRQQVCAMVARCFAGPVRRLASIAVIVRTPTCGQRQLPPGFPILALDLNSGG